MFLLFGRALAPVFLHPLQDGGKNLEKVYYKLFTSEEKLEKTIHWQQKIYSYMAVTR